MKQSYVQILIAAGLILMTASLRIVGAEMYLYNFAPVAAVGLFAGAVLKDKRFAFLFALAGQFLGDLYFHFFTTTPGFYGIGAQALTYGGLIAATCLGFFMKNLKPVRILSFTLGGSFLFFLMSNFGYFLQGWNGYTWGGLVKTYGMALPFYRNSLIGDMIGSGLLFGIYLYAQHGIAARLRARNADV